MGDRTTNRWCLSAHGVKGCTGYENVEHPLDVDWPMAKANGAAFSVISFADMTGKGMIDKKGIGASSAGTKPKKPTLIKFETVKPEYSEGCVAMENNDFETA